MSNEHRWLAKQIDQWTADGLVTVEQAAALRARHPVPKEGLPWGMIVFSAIGAIVMGLGVILLLAYNWDALPKFVKLALVFGSIVGMHVLGAWLKGLSDWRAGLGEAAHLFGTMLFGAGVWLVAQIYHINEHYPNGFLVWGLGALAMAWAIQSTSQGVLAIVALSIWGVAEAGDFHAPNEWSVLLLLAGVGPLAWRRGSTLLFTLGLLALHLLVLFNAGVRGSAATVFQGALGLGALLVAWARLAEVEPKTPPGWLAVARVLGWVGMMVCAYALSFVGVAGDLLRRTETWLGHGMGAWVYGWGLSVAALVSWAAVGVCQLRGMGLRARTEEWLAASGLLFVASLGYTRASVDSLLVALVFNLVVLGTGALWAVRGCRQARMGPTVAGSAVIAVLVFARYFDLFESLAVRGFVFILLGAALFFEALHFRKSRAALRAGEVGP